MQDWEFFYFSRWTYNLVCAFCTNSCRNIKLFRSLHSILAIIPSFVLNIYNYMINKSMPIYIYYITWNYLKVNMFEMNTQTYLLNFVLKIFNFFTYTSPPPPQAYKPKYFIVFFMPNSCRGICKLCEEFLPCRVPNLAGLTSCQYNLTYHILYFNYKHVNFFDI